MRLSKLFVLSATGLQLVLFLLLSENTETAVAQEQAFQLPVQIVGFPVIILSVRIANFLKRLAYSLDPNTYRRQQSTARISSRSGNATPKPIPIPSTADVSAASEESSPRPKRGAVPSSELDHHLDSNEAEKRLVKEFGPNVCIYERVCAHYAAKAQRTKSSNNIDWLTVLREYKKSPDKNKEFYLLSVFLGDIVASPNLCHQLVKRGRGCTPSGVWEQR